MPVGVRLHELNTDNDESSPVSEHQKILQALQAQRLAQERDFDHDSVIEPPEPIFIPPLQLQRQQFIISNLQEFQAQAIRPLVEALPWQDPCNAEEETHVATLLHKIQNGAIKTVLDIGCGSCGLLGTLAAPKHAANAHEDGVLDLERVIGIDVDLQALEGAIQEMGLHSSPDIFPSNRYTPLKMEIYCASLTQSVFSGYPGTIDAIVLTEVIEHLHDEVLNTFASSVLLRYRPRICIVTTPNFTFNQVFRLLSANDKDSEVVIDPTVDAEASNSARKAASTSSARVHRFPDPTGRTNRIFRHDDHKFEWTSDEFRAWAREVQRNVTEAGKDLSYDTRFDGVGNVPWERLRKIGVDESILQELVGTTATQCCLFIRRDTKPLEEHVTDVRSEPQESLVLEKFFPSTHSHVQDAAVVFDLVRDQMQLTLPLLDPAVVDDNVMWAVRQGFMEEDYLAQLSRCQRGLASLFIDPGIRAAVAGDIRDFRRLLAAPKNGALLQERGLTYLPARSQDEGAIIVYESRLDQAFKLASMFADGDEDDQECEYGSERGSTAPVVDTKGSGSSLWETLDASGCVDSSWETVPPTKEDEISWTYT